MSALTHEEVSSPLEVDRPITPLAKLGNFISSVESATAIHSQFQRDIEALGQVGAEQQQQFELFSPWIERIQLVVELVDSIASFDSSPFVQFGSSPFVSPHASPFPTPTSPFPPSSPFRQVSPSPVTSPPRHSSPQAATNLSFLLIFSTLHLFRQAIRSLATASATLACSGEASGSELRPGETTSLFQSDSDYAKLVMSESEQRSWLLACMLLASKVEELLFDYGNFKKAVRARFFSLTQEPPSSNNNNNDDNNTDLSAHRLRQQRELDSKFNACLKSVELHEQQLLTMLNFDVVTKLPHLKLLQLLKTDARKFFFFFAPSSSSIVVCGAEQQLVVPGIGEALSILNLCVLLTNLPSFFTASTIATTLLYHLLVAYASDSDCVVEGAPSPERYLRSFQLVHADFLEISAHLEAVRHLLFPTDSRLTLTSRPDPSCFSSVAGSSIRRAPECCQRKSDFDNLVRVAAGSFGTVYSAVDKQGKRVALKTLNATAGFGGFPYFMLREILFLRRLEHPNLVRGMGAIVDVHPDGDGFPIFSIVMEFVEQDLARVLEAQRQPFSIGQVKNLLDQLLAALEYLHDLRILHRDLKPSNILLSRSGVLKVADLGSLRDMQRRSLSHTEDVTTIAYRPPELLLGSACSYTTAVDSWSIGCIFFELCTRSQLFAGINEESTALNIIERKGGPPSHVRGFLFEGSALVQYSDSRISQALQANPKPRALQVSELGPLGLELLEAFLDWDPRRRITCKAARQHRFLHEEPLSEAIPDLLQ